MTGVRTVIFAKAPQAGLAKTRLAPALGFGGAAALARRLLLHAVREALAAGTGPVELCVTPAPGDPVWATLDIPAGVLWYAQEDGDLGKRMAHAAGRAAGSGQPVLLIGTDCPGLDARLLREAAVALRSHDAVLYPAADGGYVLLGLRRFHPSLFRDIAWSTAAVAASTRARIASLGWSLAGREALHDIDEPNDLQWLPAALREMDEPQCKKSEQRDD